MWSQLTKIALSVLILIIFVGLSLTSFAKTNPPKNKDILEQLEELLWDDDDFDWDQVSQWDPTKDIDEMRKRLKQMFDQQVKQYKQQNNRNASTNVQIKQPRITLTESKTHFLYTIDTTDIDPKSINVNIKDNMLTISGQVSITNNSQKWGVAYQSVVSSSFKKSFTLPESADSSKVDAEKKDNKFIVKVAKK